jgi:hypothetical protein
MGTIRAGRRCLVCPENKAQTLYHGREKRKSTAKSKGRVVMPQEPKLLKKRDD